ncbi:SSPO [Symbiodinium sp. CCMP2456]|nr:SSPO [Symbiodinium sp. CCMP2456]
MYDDDEGNDIGFIARDTDILIASVDFAADTVTSLAGTDEYYAHLTKGYNSGDLVFVAEAYGTSSTTNAGEVYVSGTYFIVPSVDTVSYPDVLATAASAPSQFTSTDNVVDYYQHQTSSVSEVHMKITNYYTGSNSDNWKVFDGSYTSAVQVQEPDLLWEGEGLQSRVHSVTLYTTTSGNDYTAYFQTSDLSSGSWSSGDIQNATAEWVQQSSYWKWTIPIKAETMKLEVRLRGSGLTFADTPDGSQHASRSLQLSGFEVNLRSTVTTTVTATMTTTHTETVTSTSTSATTSTITVTTTTLTSFPSVGFDSHADLKCASTGESSSGLTDATEDQCKLECWSSSTCIGFNYAAAGGGADNCKLLASFTSLAAETGTTCYLRMATGMCPYQFQYAYYTNSAYCCKTNKEKDDGSGASCDGSAMHAGNTVSMCCEGNNFIVCPNPPCSLDGLVLRNECRLSVVHLGNDARCRNISLRREHDDHYILLCDVIHYLNLYCHIILYHIIHIHIILDHLILVHVILYLNHYCHIFVYVIIHCHIFLYHIIHKYCDDDFDNQFFNDLDRLKYNNRNIKHNCNDFKLNDFKRNGDNVIDFNRNDFNRNDFNRYLHWSSVYSALFSDAYEQSDEFFWSVEFVSSGTVRLKNVKEGTYLASDGSTLSLESTSSAAGLWKYATVDESVTLQHSSSSKYLCTDAFPGLSDSCQSRSWTVTFLANTVSASVFTSVTVTTTSLTSTTRRDERERPPSIPFCAFPALVLGTYSCRFTLPHEDDLYSDSYNDNIDKLYQDDHRQHFHNNECHHNNIDLKDSDLNHYHVLPSPGSLSKGHYLQECHSDTALSKDVWQHVAFVYDKDAKTQSIYIDGNLDKTCSGIESLNTDESNQFYLGGALQRGVTTTWTGSIADVNIFLQVLTAEQLGVSKLTACYALAGTDCRTHLHSWHTKGACLVDADTSGLNPKTCSTYCAAYGMLCLKAAQSSGSCALLVAGSFKVCTKLPILLFRCECYPANWAPQLVNPTSDSSQRTYSSSFADTAKIGALDDTSSDQMWRAATDSDENMIIDIGSNNYYVCGVITQGSGSADYWVNTFEAAHAPDNSNYAPIAGTFSTAGDKTTQKLARFPLPMRARYVRIWPSTVNGALAMRAGLVTCGPLRAGTSGNHATNAGVTCHADVSNCGTQITDGSKCTDSATFSGAVATASTELCTSKYWVQLDLGATLSNDAPTKLVNKVVVYGCQNLMYCGRALELSSDGTTWSTVYEANTAYDDDDPPNVTYSAVESGSGSVFRFDLRPIRYVKVWSSISSSALQVHFAEIEVYEQAAELNYQFDTEMASTAVTMGQLSNLGMLSDYTFMAYWKASSLTTNELYPIFGQTQTSGLNFFVKQTATNTVQLEHKLDGSDGCSTSATSVSANWNHVVLSFTASTKASTFYLNGAAVSPTCAAQISATDGSVEYGGGLQQGTWSGSLQQAKVYTRTVLSEDLTNFSNWCSTYTCGPGYRRDSSKSGTCSTASCTDAECCEEWPTCATTDCTQDSKYTSRRRNYCFRSCTETLCCTWRVLGSFTLTGTSTPTVTTHSTASWVDAGSTCKDQFDDALPVTTSGTVDRTTAGTYTITYQCTENNGNTVLDTKTRTVTVVESMYINPALYWVVQREAGSWTDTVSKCWDTADTFDADVADMHQSETWDASARLYNGASGGVTEENRTITYTCSLTSEKIERTLMIRDAIRSLVCMVQIPMWFAVGDCGGTLATGKEGSTFLGPFFHSCEIGETALGEICDTTDTNPGASNDKGEGTYLQLDLGSALKVAGVKTKGHSTEEAWLKTYTVAYSTDGSSWNDVSGTFTANTDQNTEVEAMLPSIVEAQWWRIIAKTFHNVVAARAAIMVCSSTSTSTDADCLCGYVAAPAEEACRTDVTVDCIDATGTAQTPSLSPSIIKALDSSETVVTYSCTGAPDYTRTVKIRDSISLVGSSSVLVPGGVSGQWNVASSGTSYETGSTCITHEGEELTPSVDLDYLPFTTECPSCDGGTIGLFFS